jgi:4'-phosphopantetheinyl transferase
MPGPLNPALGDRSVHVWRVDLSALDDDLAELLSDEERARAERFTHDREQRLWMRSRGMLRTLLGRYLTVGPSALRLAVGVHGKPELPAESRISFNLSHSRHLALYGFTDMGSVGVDVELPRRSIDEVALAARAFGPPEAQSLADLDRETRTREFLRMWTRHEAELKFRGIGMGGPPVDAGRKPWIAELAVGSQAAAAIASQEPPRTLHCWDWPRPEDPRADAFSSTVVHKSEPTHTP